MHIDPEVAATLSGFPSIPPLSDVEASRTFLATMKEHHRHVHPRAGEVDIDERRIQPEGHDVSLPVRIYRPLDAAVAARPVIVYLHGGGWTMGDLDTGEADCIDFALGANCVVVNVDYRVAPEDPFPAALDDAYAALSWTWQNAAQLGADPALLAVGGVSAGANLSAALALLARDRGAPPLVFQMLIQPPLDDRCETPSMHSTPEDTPVLTPSRMRTLWGLYLGDATDEPSPYAAPARATSLAGLPPAYLVTCQLDPLRDEVIAYARRLMENGVGVELHVYPSVPHGFDGMCRETAIARRANRNRVEALRSAFANAPVVESPA